MKAMLCFTLTVVIGGAGVLPAAGQSSPPSQTPDARSATAARVRRLQLQAHAQELEAVRRSLLTRLDRGMSNLQTSLRTLRAEEERAGKSAVARKRLQPLQTRVAEQQREVRNCKMQIEDLTRQQSRLRREMARSEQQLAASNRELALAPGSPHVPGPGGMGGAGFPQRLETLQVTNLLLPSLTILVTRAEQEERRARVELIAAEAALKSAMDTLATSKRQAEAGVKPSVTLSGAEFMVVRARSELESAKLNVTQRAEERQRITRLAALQRPVNVELRDASVRDAAQAITQSAGVTVRAEDNVPAAKRLTVVASGVPLATILDSIARQTGLLIAPHEEGVSLRPMPMLEVNGQRTPLMSPYVPWSSEWGMNPASGLGMTNFGGYSRGAVPVPDRLFSTAVLRGGGVPGKDAAPGSAGSSVPVGVAGGAAPSKTGTADPLPSPLSPDQPAGVAPPPVAPAPEGSNYPYYQQNWPSVRNQAPRGLEYGVPRPTAGPGPISMIPLGESAFVVANPAAGPGGAPALMLTVYRVDSGGQIRIVSTILHRLQAVTGTPGSRPTPSGYSVPRRSTTPRATEPANSLRAR